MRSFKSALPLSTKEMIKLMIYALFWALSLSWSLIVFSFFLCLKVE